MSEKPSPRGTLAEIRRIIEQHGNALAAHGARLDTLETQIETLAERFITHDEREMQAIEALKKEQLISGDKLNTLLKQADEDMAMRRARIELQDEHVRREEVLRKRHTFWLKVGGGLIALAVAGNTFWDRFDPPVKYQPVFVQSVPPLTDPNKGSQ